MGTKSTSVGTIDTIDLSTPEKALMESIIEAATHHGWLHFHAFDMRRSDAGFPDLFLIRPRDGRMLAIETKSQTGRLTDDQRRWLKAFNRAGVMTIIARPSDLDYIVYEVLE